ncbi:MAG: hypothetical protein ACI91F_003443 [Candidatus Binatia bacterium]|jgi:hypothetical protein
MNELRKDGSQNGEISVPARQLASCGDVSCELLVDPIPRPTPEPIEVILKPKESRVRFVDHSKPNSMKILRMSQRILRERGIEVEEEILDKGDASQRMPGELLGLLSREKGLVLCGVSD